jgi:pimeloyl-ACP methyl ester carboxylesterase
MTATRAEGRVVEAVAAPGGSVMCYTHVPAGRPAGGVVVCRPLFLEASENHRAELRLAEALVGRGFAVQRFDYRGCGNSQGDVEKLTLASAEEDCLLAAARLRKRTGTDALGVVGTRWAALVAAGVSRELDARAVAFWEAKPDGRSYVDELARTRAFTGLWRDDYHPVEYHRRRLAEGHALDVLGWRVHPGLVNSSRGESVAGRLGRGVPARVVYGRGRRADGERVTAELRAVGCAVTESVLPERVLWWVGVNRLVHPEQPASPLELEAEATADWLAAELAALGS